MLTYHPAFDIYHCKFRILQLLSIILESEVEVERLQIWDFFFLFPHEINKQFKFTKELRPLRRIFKYEYNPYEEILDAKKVFERMKPYQLLALKNLASYELINRDALENNIVIIQKENIPSELQEKLGILSDRQENVIKLVTSPFNDLPLYGKLGFKMRTGLIDFKYDKDN